MKRMSIKERLALLWAALKNVVTGTGVTLVKDGSVTAHASPPGLSAEHWVLIDGTWKHATVTFDYTRARGYIDSKLTSE